jgi:hypothetical protein
MASLWSELEALGNDVGSHLDYGDAAKVVLLSFAGGAYTRRADVLYGWAIEEGFDPTVGADGFWLTLPVIDPAVEALIYDLATADLALVTDPAQPAGIFHIIRKVPAVTEPRQARIFTQRVEDVWNDQ